MEKTVIVGFAGGFVEARINYNGKTQKWDVDFMGPSDEYLKRPYEIDKNRGVTSFDTPRESLLWIAENELGWKDDKEGKPMFIGENLNERQVAVLQAVADRSSGCLCASVKGVKEEAEQTPSRFHCLYNKNDKVPLKRLNRIIDELATEGLVERSERNGKQYVGLTDYGKRCNRIVDFL